MHRLLLGLSERRTISAGAVRLMAGVCLLLCVSSAAAYRGSRPKPGSNSAIALQTASGETRRAEIRELKQGEVIERELAGGESHTYRITVKLGQYINVVVEQKGIDVVVRLFGPDGQKIAEVDNPNGTQGPEPISAIAGVAGEYRLAVTVLDEKVAAGRYEVKVEQLRESTAQDRDRIAIERLLAEAEQLRDKRTAESFRKAIEKYDEVLPMLRKMGDRQGEATTLNRLGVVYSQLGDNRQALEYLSQALPLWQAMGDRQKEAMILHNIGVIHRQLSDSQKALEYYSRALPMRRASGDREGEAITLNQTGQAYNDLGRLQEALDYFNQALVIQRAIGDRPSEALTLNNIGLAYFRFGELQKASEYYSQALALQRTVGDRRGEAAGLTNIGLTYSQLGEQQKALEYYNQALPLHRATGDRNGEFTTISNIGLAHWSLGELQKALEYYSQALTLVRALRDRRGEANTLHNIGLAHWSLGEQQKALEYYNQALPLRRAVGDRLGEAITLSVIGESHSSLGKPEEALRNLEQALSLHRAVGDRGNEAVTLQRIARAERDRGRLREARAQIEAALNIIESTRSKFVSQQLRTSFLASRQSFYEFYVALLMRMHRDQPSAGYDAVALQTSERARARSLLEMLTEARADIEQGVDAVLIERGRSLQQQLSVKAERLTRLLSGKPTDEQAAAARKEVEALLGEYQDIEAQIRSKSPRYAALTQPQPLSLKEIQRQVLDPDTLLLEYALGEERSFLWAVTPASIQSYELPGRAEIEVAAQRFYELVTTRKNRELQSQTDAATALSRILLGPVAAQLGQKRLLIVSDGTLRYIPFAALPDPVAGSKRTDKYQPLIIKHEIVSLPSASTLGVLRRELTGRLPAAKTVAVLADPVFQINDLRVKQGKARAEQIPARPDDKIRQDVERSGWESGVTSFERLEYSRKEAEAIVAQTPVGQSLKALDFGASREAALSGALGQYRIVHFATHSLLNNVHPELSGIVLSLVDETGKSQNGFVRLHEVYNLKLPVELVVLSACQTGLGKDIKGEGLVGLTRGFMYAGAPRVVVSLWSVSDEATAELMKQFYQGMLKRGLRPAAALRAAQVSIWKSQWWEGPYYWAGFVLQGEWK